MWIAFEGTNGSGKTSQLERVRKYIETNTEHPIHVQRHPGIPRLREVLLDPDTTWDPVAARLVFTAEYIQSVQGLDAHVGSVVLMDRVAPVSNWAYGKGEGASERDLYRLMSFMDRLRSPDLTFIFDCPVYESEIRLREQQNPNKYDLKDVQFKARVLAYYREWYNKFGDETTFMINTSKGVDDAFLEIVKILHDHTELFTE